MKAQSHILAAAVFFMVVAAVLLAGCQGKPRSAGREIAALVNGEKIYFDEVYEEYHSLTPARQEVIALSDALSFLIEREVLYQEAARKEISASDSEVAGEYEFYLLANNLTEEQLEGQLEERNSSIEKLKASLKKQVMIGKLLDQAIPRSFTIKQEEVMAIYNASRYPSLGIPFGQAEKAIVDFITAQRQQAQRAAYIESLKSETDVLIVAVPG